MSWICPGCGYENDDSADFCDDCMVEPRPEEPASDEDRACVSHVGNEGHVSARPQATCRQAGTRPSLRMASSEWVGQADPIPLPEGSYALVLENFRDRSGLVIDVTSCLLGREGDFAPEFFSQDVSRRHLFVRYEDDGWVAMEYGSSNGTRLSSGEDEIALRPGTPERLHDGDFLYIASMGFKVQISPCSRFDEAAKCEADENSCPAGGSGEPGDAAGREGSSESSEQVPQKVRGRFICCMSCNAVVKVEGGADLEDLECPGCGSDLADAYEWSDEMPEGEFLVS